LFSCQDVLYRRQPCCRRVLCIRLRKTDGVYQTTGWTTATKMTNDDTPSGTYNDLMESMLQRRRHRACCNHADGRPISGHRKLPTIAMISWCSGRRCCSRVGVPSPSVASLEFKLIADPKEEGPLNFESDSGPRDVTRGFDQSPDSDAIPVIISSEGDDREDAERQKRGGFMDMSSLCMTYKCVGLRPGTMAYLQCVAQSEHLHLSAILNGTTPRDLPAVCQPEPMYSQAVNDIRDIS